MLLNHIKSRDLFASFSEEKMDSGCGSQSSMQESQDFLSDLYPSQSTRMYRKYVNEPPLYKPAGQPDLYNKSSSKQNADYRKIKAKENDDRTLVTAVVTAVKDSSSEVKECLQQIFRNINESLSKNDGTVDQMSEKFGCEFQKQCEKLLSAIEINNQHKQEISEKERQIQVLDQQVKSLEAQSCLESKVAEIIAERFSDQKSYLSDSFQRFSSSIAKQRTLPARNFDSDLKTLENQKKEFASLKSFVQKTFKDLEKRLSLSSQDIIEETKRINTDTNMKLLMKIQEILKSCSGEFYDHLHTEFIDLYKEQKQEIERNVNLWNETLRLDLKSAFCDLNSSYKQSFKEVFMKISHNNNEMKTKMLEFEKELKKLHSNNHDHLLPCGMNRGHIQNKNIQSDNVQYCYSFLEENDAQEKSIMPFETQRKKMDLKDSNISAVISTPFASREYYSPYESRKKCRTLKRRSRYLMNSEITISPFGSPAFSLLSHTTSPGVSLKEIHLTNKSNCLKKAKRAQYGNEMKPPNSVHVPSTNSMCKNFWDL